MRRRFVIALFIWILLHVYAGVRLIPPLGLGVWGTALAWTIVAALGLAPLAALVTVPQRQIGRTVRWIGWTSMGLSTLIIVMVLATDILFVRLWGVPAWVLSPLILAAATVSTAIGAWRARRPQVVRVDVPIRSLPADLEGFRIVQLTDLHVGSTIRRHFVQAVVDLANGLAPDLVAFTGDVADGTVPGLHPEVAPLADLAAPYGKFFVSGNHEYYWDALAWIAEIERLGFNVLTNEHRLLERGAGRLLLAGVTDAGASRRVPGHASDPGAALAGAPPADVKILLAHQPRSAFAAQAAGFDLQLSGHTHGGQFPFNVLVRIGQPFVSGLHRLGALWVYVSQGTGYWGPPLRLGAPPEITLIELHAAT